MPDNGRFHKRTEIYDDHGFVGGRTVRMEVRFGARCQLAEQPPNFQSRRTSCPTEPAAGTREFGSKPTKTRFRNWARPKAVSRANSNYFSSELAHWRRRPHDLQLPHELNQIVLFLGSEFEFQDHVEELQSRRPIGCSGSRGTPAAPQARWRVPLCSVQSTSPGLMRSWYDGIRAI
jgi:hypothetical protein